jgi:phospholipid/cholesterol/gamma-HCH transport system permease protein
MVRELGPVLCALMVAGRAASGIAAELGSMRVTEQIDALQSFGTDPIRKLVTPRILAGLLMLPVLTVITDIVGILGGMIISVFRIGITADAYMQGVLNTLAQSGFMLRLLPEGLRSGC